jgi:hypothetical protein
LKDFGFLLEDFLKIIFLHGEIFEFSKFFFCLKIIPFNVNGKVSLRDFLVLLKGTLLLLGKRSHTMNPKP